MAELGLYEAFKKYIKNQLNVRKAILGAKDFTADEEIQVPFLQPKLTNIKFGKSNALTNRSLESLHYSYLSKKCTIRMMSGVDLEDSAYLKVLKPNEKDLLGSKLAKKYILEGNIKGGGIGKRGAYGDPLFRSGPSEGYGIVPMPGITDAQVNTVSKEGALREATVNFVCHNKDQLEVLELLYMRPGYNVLVEWSWAPYVNNDLNVETENPTAKSEFFKPESDLDKINAKIKNIKERTCGNYDGFLGYIKNFSIKSREDGGYNCTTEIVSHNDLLQSLQIGSRVTYTNNLVEGTLDKHLEVSDDYLFYLRSILKNVKKAGDEHYLNIMGTDDELQLKKSEQFEDRNNSASLEEKNPIETAGSGYTIYADAFLTENSNVTTDENKESKEVLEKVEELNTVNGHYITGMNSVVELVKKITKGKTTDLPKKVYDENQGTGLNVMLNGTILKQVVQYDVDKKVNTGTSGFKSHVFVRWDLLVQILNQEIIKHYKPGKPIAEITYCSLGTPIVHDLENLDNSGSLSPTQDHFYLPYSAPNNVEKADPIAEIEIDWKQYTLPQQNELRQILATKRKFNTKSQDPDSYHALLGQSYDYNICLLPHQTMFDPLFEGRSIYNNKKTGQPDQGNFNKFKRNPSLLTSFNYDPNNADAPFISAEKHSIGLIYFNLEYVLKEYEKMRLESTKAEGDEGTVYVRFKKDFNFLSYLKTIWGSVNNACGDYYEFDIHTEHERPNLARVIEKKFNTQFGKDELYKFEPQGLNSVSRDFMYDSSISRDMANVISIAAQAPSEIQSLEALSFKSFHKNIKSRFTAFALTEKDKKIEQTEAKRLLELDVKRYTDMCKALQLYLKRLGKSNFTKEYVKNNGDVAFKKTISPKTAIQYANEIEDLKISILNRYPLNYRKPEKIGLYRPNTTHSRTAVIPLNFSIKMDGIAGMLPYNVFQVDSSRLPHDYKSEDIAFIVKNETQKITQDSDWTTEITGQLVLLPNNPNNSGTNTEPDVITPPKIKEKELDLIDATKTECTTKYGFDFTPADNGDPEWDSSNITAQKMSLKYCIEELENLGYTKAGVLGTFAVVWAEASKDYESAKKIRGFNSSGAHNYAGIQTDNGVWSGTKKDGSSGYIQAQYCRKDSKLYRAFAMFEDDKTFLEFAAKVHKKKGIHTTDKDTWTKNYINKWWSPEEKINKTHKKGGSVYNTKKSFFETAEKAYNAVKAGSETYTIS